MDRRSLLQALAVSLVPIPGLDPIAGFQDKIWIAPTTKGVDAILRQPVDFFWNTYLKLVLDRTWASGEYKRRDWDWGTSEPVRVDGVAAYISAAGGEPFRYHAFEPLVVRPDQDVLSFTWIFKMDPKHTHRSIQDFKS